MQNKDTLYKILFDIYLVFFVLRTTIFVNNSYYNIIFGGCSIIFISFLINTYKGFKIKNKDALNAIVISGFVLIHIVLVLIYRHNITHLIKDVFRYIYLVCIFGLGIYYGKISSNNKRIFYTVLIIVLFHCIIGILNFIFGFGVVELHGNQRLYGFFDSAGKFGTLLGFSGIFFFINYSLYKKLIYLVLMLIALILLGLNGSLKSIVVFVGTIAFFFIVYKRKFKYLFIILFLGIVFIIVNPEIFYRVKSIFTTSYDPDKIYGTVLENSFQWRFLQWYQLISDWWHNYTLFGAGLGQETMLHGYVNSEGIPYIAHSDFVKLLIETGIIGIVFIIYLVFKLYKKMKKFVIVNNIEIFLLLFYYFLFGGILGSSLITITISLYLLYLGNLITQINSNRVYEHH